MAIIHSQLVRNYAEYDYIVPIDSTFFTKETIDPDDYQANVMSTLIAGEDSYYGFPLDVHPIVLYYNKAIVGDNELPANFTELMTLAQELTDQSSGVWGLPVSTLWPTEFTYTTALYQAGGTEIDTETSMPMFNSAEGAEAAENLRDIIYKYKVSPENLQTDADLNLFTTGKAAFHIQGCWSLLALEEALGDNLGVMSLSGLLTDKTGGNSRQVFARSHVFTVAAQRRNISQRKKEAMVTFIKWMGENSAGMVAGRADSRLQRRPRDGRIQERALRQRLRRSQRVPHRGVRDLFRIGIRDGVPVCDDHHDQRHLRHRQTHERRGSGSEESGQHGNERLTPERRRG